MGLLQEYLLKQLKTMHNIKFNKLKTIRFLFVMQRKLTNLTWLDEVGV